MRFFGVTETNFAGHLCHIDNGRVKGITPFCYSGQEANRPFVRLCRTSSGDNHCLESCTLLPVTDCDASTGEEGAKRETRGKKNKEHCRCQQVLPPCRNLLAACSYHQHKIHWQITRGHCGYGTNHPEVMESDRNSDDNRDAVARIANCLVA